MVREKSRDKPNAQQICLLMGRKGEKGIGDRDNPLFLLINFYKVKCLVEKLDRKI